MPKWNPMSDFEWGVLSYIIIYDNKMANNHFKKVILLKSAF